jgi:hypothetical protein
MTIERAFVISLPFRDDRLNNFFRQTKSITSLPEVEVWPAIHGDTCCPPDSWTAGNGAWGCYKSHLNILEYCLNNGISSYIVFEDDAQFKHDFEDKYSTFMKEVPSDWQQIYLGGDLQHWQTHPPIKVSDNVYRPYNVNRTHCFLVSRSGMLPIYQHISDLPFRAEEHIDHHLGRWHEDYRNNVYCPAEWLVGQMGFTSNVSGNLEEITFYSNPASRRLDHWLYDTPVCIYYRGPKNLLRLSRAYLHPGNQLDANGYDVTLTNAVKYIDPEPEIYRWYNWIRSEIAHSNSSALPCFYQPRFLPEVVAAATKAEVIEIEPRTVDELKVTVQEIRRKYVK